MADEPFLTDIQTLRARARQPIEQGAVTPCDEGDRGEDPIAERIASDEEMLTSIGEDDPTTRRMLAGILAVEEHAD